MLAKYLFKKKRNIFLAALFDFLGGFFFGIFKKKSIEKTGEKTFLLIRLDHIGDILSSLSLPKILKENHTNCKVVFLTSSPGAELLRHNPFVDEIIIYDVSWFARKTDRVARKTRFSEIVKKLRKAGIGTAFGLRGDLRENFLMWCAKIPNRVGYGITGGGFFLTQEVRYRPGVHQTEHALDLLRAQGIPAEWTRPTIYFEKFLAEGILSTPFAVFQVKSGSAAKDWETAHINNFMEQFTKNFPKTSLVLIGAKGEERDSLDFSNNSKILDLRDKTGLRELCGWLQKSSVAIGPDSGPMHIAAALGVPTVFLYSGTNSFEEWRPLYENAVALRHDVPCSPCARVACNVKGHPCLSEIRPEQVVEAVKKIL